MGMFSMGLLSLLFQQRSHPSGSRFGGRYEGPSPELTGLTGTCSQVQTSGWGEASDGFLVFERMDFPMPMALELG